MKLNIAIDPGFDSIKAIANGKAIKFPFNAVETDERKISDYGTRPDFMLYKDENGATYRVGQYAREMMFEGKQECADDFWTEQRFLSKEFTVVVRTTIAVAIEQLGLSMDGLEIAVIVALPHACRTAYASTIAGTLATRHVFDLKLGKGDVKQYAFTIREENVYTVSQTIAAILGESSDENGNIDEDRYCYLSNGPTLVLDGGYYTFGFVSVGRGGSVDDDMAESDTDHAMKNVYKAMAESVNDKRPDIRHYMIDYLLNQGGKVRYMDKGQAAVIDLNELRKKKETEVCCSLIAKLNKRYNNLLDYNYVLVTGGTGARFYGQLLEYYKACGVMDEEHMLLTHAQLGDTEHSIEFSIAVGAYKGLIGKTS